nr:hypothetical protein [Chitinophagaceae bacterium]
MLRIFVACLALCSCSVLFAQKKPGAKPTDAPPAQENLVFQNLKYRLVGPFRGGRSAAVAGSYSQKNVFYFGATGGGLWKTTDGGSNWKNISDGYLGGNIGSIAVAPSDETIIYAGEGEKTMRGNVSEGLGGMWRTDDGGK